MTSESPRFCAARDLGPALVSEFDGAPRYHRWEGRSGRRYLAAVCAPEQFELPEDSVVLLVRLAADGGRRVAEALSFAAADELALRRLRAAVERSGADELHVHLLARTAAARSAMLHDLCAPRAAACPPSTAAA